MQNRVRAMDLRTSPPSVDSSAESWHLERSSVDRASYATAGYMSAPQFTVDNTTAYASSSPAFSQPGGRLLAGSGHARQATANPPRPVPPMPDESCARPARLAIVTWRHWRTIAANASARSYANISERDAAYAGRNIPEAAPSQCYPS